MKNLKYFLFFVFLTSSLFANEPIKEDTNQTAKISKLKNDIKVLNESVKDDIWIKRYNNYLAYRQIEAELEQTKLDAKKYSAWEGVKYKELSYQLTNKIKIKENELSLIDEYKDSPI